ncbi:MAG: aldehyde dehydrogenase family protein, partial [Calditrichaeota bacterium]|nr:aldehyde dehydrogenase family protein [Calditrichota bacterium]
SDIILEQKSEIAHLIATEQGKPVTEALGAEVVSVLSILKDLYRNGRRVLERSNVRPEQILFVHKKSSYRYEPFGVVAIISPWNYPFSVPVPEIAAALFAGNTVIFKPAPHSILIGEKIDEIFKMAGFPHGVMNTVIVDDRDAPVISEHPAVDKIVFTGSTNVGSKIMSSAAKAVTPILLELGGKDAAIVAADANIERAAKGIVWGAMFTTGQVCASVERVYVESNVSEKFIDACIRETKKLKIGDPLDKDTDIGPLSHVGQLNHIDQHIEDAVEKGARIVVGGKRMKMPGYFFEPTILTNVDHTMDVMIHETFGPVLPVMTVKSLDEAIELANDSIYGLSAYGWTENKNTAERLMNELEAGTVMINDSTSSWGEATAPWGGMKKSSIGRTRSRFGLLEMVQVKYASYDRGNNAFNPWWFPYDSQARQFFIRALDLLFQQNVLKKMMALFSLLKVGKFVRTAHWWAILKNLNKL